MTAIEKNIVVAIAKNGGKMSVSTLTHNNAIGEGCEVHGALMKLDYDGVINVVNGGKTVELA